MARTSQNLDYIPVHTSDLGTFKKCRRRWNWVSPMRENLSPKVSVSGINFNLWFGTGIHVALELYYDPALKRHPVEVWNTWYHDSVRELQEKNPGFYDENEEEFLEHFHLGTGMMEFYHTYAEKNDQWFEVIETESDFAVPLGFNALDPRDGEWKEVRYCGRRDVLIRNLDNGRYGLIDHKTTSRIDEDFFIKLEMDEQCTGYMWATEQEREIEIDFVVYNSLRKVCPKLPTVLKSGKLSLDRTNESTTAAMFEQAVKDNDLEVWLFDTEKAGLYLDYLKEVGDEQFVLRHTVKRNRNEIHEQGINIELVAKDMLDAPSLYPNPSASWYCTKCPLRPPCLAMNDGSDHWEMLEYGFESNPDR
jgi:hypothetical protein